MPSIIDTGAAEPPRAPVPTLPAQADPPSADLIPSRAEVYAQILIATGVALAICYVAQKVLITLLVSVLLAVMLEPIVGALQRVRIPRSLGAFITVAAVVALCYGGMQVSYNRASDFVQNLPKYTNEVRQTVLRFRRQAQELQKTTDAMLATPPQDRRPVTVYRTSWSDAITSVVGPITEFLLFLSTIPFLVYFMLTWKDHSRIAMARMFQKGEHRTAALSSLTDIALMIRRFFVGNLVVGLFIGAASTVVFWRLGLQTPFAVGFISGIMSLVPYLGVVLAMVPPLLVGVGQIGRAEIGAIALTAAGLHLFAFSVLYPKLLGRHVELNPLAVTIALLVWGWLWGALGLLFALPLTAVIKIVCDHVIALRPLGQWLGESVDEDVLATDR